MLIAIAMAMGLVADPPAPQRSALAMLVHETALIAGRARYCGVDADLLEEYIARAQASMAGRTQDQATLIAARIEFTNRLAAAAARTPDGGCADATEQLEAELRRLN